MLKKELIYFYVTLILVCVLFPLGSKIIGKDLETLHYIRRGIMPFATIAFFITIYYIFVNNRLFLKAFSILVFITLLTFGLSIQIKATKNIRMSQAKNEELHAVFDWFNHYTQKYSIIGSVNTSLNMLIPVYTTNKIYFPPTYRSITPTYEEIERYAILSNLLGINLGDQKKELDNNASHIFSFQAYNQQKHKFEIDSKRSILAESQLDTLSSINLKSLITKYRIDYIVITPDEIKNIHPHFELLRPLTSINGYLIFKVI
jgi:hypothetical protein